MPTAEDHSDARVMDVRCDQSVLALHLADGRTISAPLTWYPQLSQATSRQRQHWEHAGGGDRVIWPLLTFEIGAEDLLSGTDAPNRPRDFTTKKLYEEHLLKRPTDHTLGEMAYIVADGADAFYEPSSTSAVRMTPQYGNLVDILAVEGGWLCIRWSGLKGWVDRSIVSSTEPPKRVEPSTPVRSSYAPHYEVGPRGGLFTRTRLGFRRYL